MIITRELANNQKMKNDRNDVLIKMGVEVHITPTSTQKVFNLNRSSLEKIACNEVEAWEVGYLGTLPLLNGNVIKLALRLCAFLNMEIANELLFDRKIYNYPDLSKGFQITQQKQALGSNGYLVVFADNGFHEVKLARLQIEEDTAKSFYDGSGVTLDFNRAGNPLFELVTEPVFDNTEKLLLFLKQLANTLIYLGISDAKMEAGQFRIDLNFSFRIGAHYSTPRYEVKNLNSLKNLKNAINYEIEKHLKNSNKEQTEQEELRSETLGFNEQTQSTFTQREKTNYFYLPEVNIPLIKITDNELQAVRSNLPMQPAKLWQKLAKLDSNNKKLPLVFESPLLLYLINLLEQNKIAYQTNLDALVTFFQNYLVIAINDLNYEQGRNFLATNFAHIARILELWTTNLLTKSDMVEIISMLNNKEVANFNLEEKLSKLSSSHEKVDSSVLEEEINLIIANEKISEKVFLQPAKLSNLLFGSLKKKFTNMVIDPQVVNEIAKAICARKLDNCF